MIEPPLKILLIGSAPPPIGGTQISFEYLIEELSARRDVEINVVNTSGIRGKSIAGFPTLCKAIAHVAVAASKVDVITMHVGTNALPFWGCIVLAIARISRKPLVVRKFAGTDYWKLGRFKGAISHFVLKHCDLYLAQTKQLVNAATNSGISHVKWFPTSRPRIDIPEGRAPDGQSVCKNFIFVGQVRQDKGILELIEAAERFDGDVSVDIYGPWFPDLKETVLDGCRIVAYKGELAANDVVPTMRLYDACLLPTKWYAEGYPGVVIESFMAGLPVITTFCGGIPELVDETCGVLVDSGDSEALFEAMQQLVLDVELCARLRNGASARAEEFSADVWTENFVEFCREVCAE